MNIRFEKLHKDLAQELFELTDENRAYLREWLPWLDHTNCVADTLSFIESTEKGHPTFAVILGQKICGVAGFHHIDYTNKHASIGYWLAEQYIGKGIITRAVKHLLQMGFDEYELNKIEIRCATGNIRSRAVAERLGFTHEATLKQREWLYSRFVDHAVYSVLASDFYA